ncbi:hypothetical protein DDB_G0289513 [Dictyostelium discoideum AX4]|uniref:Replication protein A subunit n=1 Tax=Dictyostelium discoideum TaxID=44689 RepID=Q54HE3_DICDI|nr:hypothetical protein DDB_G0289513 [Dictyostelium discoideum AX4]EAL62688.1 hypothetical protein DDB_G0289513 [Dictyostelium discoideum AX4]|eukprot:XP_636195.1 hypothetical protein DDB_G0289513 [Dictyostelium discoideum AX4]
MSINRGCLTNIINVDQTKRFQNIDCRVQVIKTKQSSSNNLEIHLSDQDHIFVGISKTDPSNIPINSIVNLSDFSINFPKRFLNIVQFNVISQEKEIKTAQGKALTYHSVYKKTDGNSQNSNQPQPQQQQQHQQQQQPRANTTMGSNSGIASRGNPLANQRNQAGAIRSNNNFGGNSNNNNNNNYNNNNNNNNNNSGGGSNNFYADLSTQPITDIESIAPGMNVQFTIRAMVRNKQPLKSWNKGANGEGKLFSMELVDSTGEIKCACFSDSSNPNNFINALYDCFENGKVYFIQRFFVKSANKLYNTLSHQSELSINSESRVMISPDQTQFTPHYNFKKIADIENLEKNDTVDVIGAITNIDPIANLTSKQGKEFTKFGITIADDTNASINVVFWNEKATEVAPQVKVGDIIAMKGVKVSDFSGRTLSYSFGSSFGLNDEQLQETSNLRAHLQNFDVNSLQSLTIASSYTQSSYEQVNLPIFLIRTISEGSPLFISDPKTNKKLYRTIGQFQRVVPLSQAGEMDKGDEISSKMEWKYKACKKCKKSCPEGSCPQCGSDDWEYAYRMSLKLSDGDDAISVEVMGKTGDRLFGKSAAELYQMNQEQINEIFNTVLSNNYVVSLAPSSYMGSNGQTYNRFNVYDFANLYDTPNKLVSGPNPNAPNQFQNYIESSFNDCRLFNE